MVDEMKLRMDELVNNPTARVPVCLCLDTSSSMSGNPIEELNQGVEAFLTELKSDEVAQYSAEVAVVTFGGVASKALDFAALSSQTVPRLAADGGTPMGAGVEMALNLLEKRKREYADAGVDYYQPWLVLMTDGQPTDAIETAVARTVALLEVCWFSLIWKSSRVELARQR
jgi:uncharacterized protein YegL